MTIFGYNVVRVSESPESVLVQFLMKKVRGLAGFTFQPRFLRTYRFLRLWFRRLLRLLFPVSDTMSGIPHLKSFQ